MQTLAAAAAAVATTTKKQFNTLARDAMRLRRTDVVSRVLNGWLVSPKLFLATVAVFGRRKLAMCCWRAKGINFCRRA